MKYRTLGRTGLEVSEIGFGAWAIGGDKYGNSYGPTDDEVSRAAVAKAVDLGCNFFDTADVYGYGHSEELLGQVLPSKRQKILIATKVGGDFTSGKTKINFSKSYIRFAVDESLRRLRTDTIDLYQLHNPPFEMIRDGDIFSPLEYLRKEGKIRSIGLSIFEPEEGLAALRLGVVDALQVVYNLFETEPAKDLFPAAKEAGVAIIAREPLANGLLTGKYDHRSAFPRGDIRHDFPRETLARRVKAAEALGFLERPGRTLVQSALRFVLAQDAVAVTIPGCKTPEQVEENLKASEVEPPPPEELSHAASVVKEFLR